MEHLLHDLLGVAALVSLIVLPVLFFIDLDERRLEKAFDQALKIGNDE